MRSLIFLALILPSFATAQINRSAREFASEKVQEYVVTKLFINKPYKPVSFGEIKNHKEENSEIAWKIEHKFEITETRNVSDQGIAVPKSYKFLFYLDHKMKVQRAESFFSY